MGAGVRALAKIMTGEQPSRDPDQNFNPVTYLDQNAPDLKADHLQSFVGLPNKAAADNLQASIRARAANDRIRAASGNMGTIVTTLLNPMLYAALAILAWITWRAWSARGRALAMMDGALISALATGVRLHRRASSAIGVTGKRVLERADRD
jgi:hypothetical protein